MKFNEVKIEMKEKAEFKPVKIEKKAILNLESTILDELSVSENSKLIMTSIEVFAVVEIDNKRTLEPVYFTDSLAQEMALRFSDFSRFDLRKAEKALIETLPDNQRVENVNGTIKLLQRGICSYKNRNIDALLNIKIGYNVVSLRKWIEKAQSKLFRFLNESNRQYWQALQKELLSRYFPENEEKQETLGVSDEWNF